MRARKSVLCHLLYNWQVRIILLILLLRRKAHLQNLCHRQMKIIRQCIIHSVYVIRLFLPTLYLKNIIYMSMRMMHFIQQRLIRQLWPLVVICVIGRKVESATKHQQVSGERQISGLLIFTIMKVNIICLLLLVEQMEYGEHLY